MAWVRRLSPLESTYTKERSVPVCLATLDALGFDLAAEKGIRTDLDDRPQKSPRACVIASDPPRVVHLITRAQGGLHDYEAFLHEAGHALHYAGCEASLALPFRRLSRDHALTEIYSFLLDSIVREPRWHAEHFGLSDAEARENADAARFSNTILYRRYSAKLGYELDFWGRFPSRGAQPDGYAERLTAATGIRYAPSNYLADMDAGFYSADYLRAWIRSAQLARTCGARWGRTGGGGRRPARCCATSSARARVRRPRTSPSGSATTRWTPPRSPPSSAAPPDIRTPTRAATPVRTSQWRMRAPTRCKAWARGLDRVHRRAL